MRVISKARLRQFWELPGHEDSEGALRAWHTYVNSHKIDWQSWAELKEHFANASLVGNCVVFNIGGNKYRLVTRVLYTSQKVFVLRVMDHQEYDLNRWKETCGCYEDPPGKQQKTPAKKKRK